MGLGGAYQELKVTQLRSSTIHPVAGEEKNKEKRRYMFLSNIDQVLNFNVETVQFFRANPEFPPEIVAEKLESALEKLLVAPYYDFLAGRLRLDDSAGQGRLEVDCNGAGAGFVAASSELSLADLGDLDRPNPAFWQLVKGRVDAMGIHDRPLFILQVTSFKCGGFAMSISNNHTTFDGVSFRMFLENLASLAADKPPAVTPCNNRQLLAARFPPRVTFPHPELVKPPEMIPDAAETNPIITPTVLIETATPEVLESKLFRMSSADISALKEKAKTDGAAAAAAAITSFNVVTAHLWRCKALATGAEVDHRGKTSTIVYAVDIRSRLRPPLPPSYTGNAVLGAHGTLELRELEEEPFGRLVEVLREGSARMDDDYARSVVDWGQLNRGGLPHGDVFVSSWWRLGFEEVEYPWGKAVYCCPLAHSNRDIILLLPATGDGVVEAGVNALVALPSHDMERFESLFNKFQL